MSVPLLTISQLAAYAGVTVRAVRHYHARGLLPEPDRDASGYRRYEAQAVMDLIRIKTLADAGVPLARVAELLRADPAEFRAATAEIDRRLREEVRRLQEHRSRVKELESAERLALPPVVLGYLERLRDLGASERGLAMERDMWVLAAAQYPDEMDAWVADKLRDLEDPGFVRFVLQLDQAYEWTPDDPRLVGLADDMAAYLDRYAAEHADDPELGGLDREALDRTLVEMMDGHVMTAFPSWERFAELMAERGWVGWTDITRVETEPTTR